MESKKYVGKCYLYTRVSTAMQVEGYSLDAQLNRLYKEAEYRDLEVVEVFSDEGKSGKSVSGRPEFQRMLNSISEMNKNETIINYVIVSKLSRFGRNAKDVLTSLSKMQTFDCNLISSDEGIDSSKDAGKLIITILSAVAEIERENIRFQTMEGRNQKAREGKWNGGRAPFGYRLEGEKNDKYLVIDEDEAEVVKIIYDKYVHTEMGAIGIAKYLNEHGYRKKVEMSGDRDGKGSVPLTKDNFDAHFVKLVLDNPICTGYISYNRRVNKKIKGTENEYHRVNNSGYDIYKGMHEAIIDLELWAAAQDKREKTGCRKERTFDKEHEFILSGIIRCPECGKKMYGKKGRKPYVRKDGTTSPQGYYYFCKNAISPGGTECTYKKTISQKRIDQEIVQIISEVTEATVFDDVLGEVIDRNTNEEHIKKDIQKLKKEHEKQETLLNRLIERQDALDPFNKETFDRKYDELERRKDKIYEELAGIEERKMEAEKKLNVVYSEKLMMITAKDIMKSLKESFESGDDKLKKQLALETFEYIDIYPQMSEGRYVKKVRFKYPVVYNGAEVREISDGANLCTKETPDETVCLLSRKAPV